MSFIVENHPALADEFCNANKKIRYIEQKNAAKDRFKRRLGNLDNKFFDIIPKSLAFKPMDNVKDFINKFVLSEAKIDVATLKENIETLSELEVLLVRSEKQLESLANILERKDNIDNKDRDIKINEILVALAEREAHKLKIESTEKEIRMKQMSLESNNENIKQQEKKISNLNNQIIELNIAINSNESNKMVEEIKRKINNLNQEQDIYRSEEEKLKQQVSNIQKYTQALLKLSYKLLTREEIEKLLLPLDMTEKANIIEKLEEFQKLNLSKIRYEDADNRYHVKQLSDEIEQMQERQRSISKQQLVYPDNVVKLKTAIEKEFERRQIHSKVYYLSELIEVSDSLWQNAVEGYLNNQKFYLVIDKEYYDIALAIYNRNSNSIHSAGIINTKKLPLNEECNNKTLAYVVTSENRFAKAYVNYILGRVVRCNNIKELENHDIAITPECMLYQGYVVRHLNPKSYQNPYIGQHAYRQQLVNVKAKLEELSKTRAQLRDTTSLYSNMLEQEKSVNIELVRLYAKAPYNLAITKQELVIARNELKEASDDPTWIELNNKLNDKNNDKNNINEECNIMRSENAKLEEQIKGLIYSKEEDKTFFEKKNIWLEQEEDNDGLVYKSGYDKYQQNRKNKQPNKIAENFAPQRAQFVNERDALLNGKDGLIPLQYEYNQKFTQDFLVGLERISDYREAYNALKNVEMVKYKEKLMSAKENCEEIFRSDFLSKMREHIENAKTEFKNLNRALNQIYYGDDSYRFKIGFDKRKEGLYRMITSENNREGNNLWTSAFEDEYKEEMAELFDKLMTKDDKGQKIVDEYTDYRSYLDYDIEIQKRDGSIQRFSDIYGEKSGSETQVPYYVAIGASFYQLYRYGNTVRLMLLDEAFDKMDDERISSMMEFFNGLGLQVILATPPAKIEVIGEKVDTVLAAIRVDQNSIVEEYDL